MPRKPPASKPPISLEDALARIREEGRRQVLSMSKNGWLHFERPGFDVVVLVGATKYRRAMIDGVESAAEEFFTPKRDRW